MCLLESAIVIFAREGKLLGSADLQTASCLTPDNMRALGIDSVKQRPVFTLAHFGNSLAKTRALIIFVYICFLYDTVSINMF